MVLGGLKHRAIIGDAIEAFRSTPGAAKLDIIQAEHAAGKPTKHSAFENAWGMNDAMPSEDDAALSFGTALSSSGVTGNCA